MQKDERDILDVLKFELDFLEKGGYRRSSREPWRPQSIFEDSPTCMNYGSKGRPEPCGECVLMHLVPAEFREAEIPCRHIPFNADGETLDSLYRYADQHEIEEVPGNWLRATIFRLEDERRTHGDSSKGPSTPGPSQTKGEPLFQSLNAKCANPGCPTTFHWLGGGKFFRFRPDSAFLQSEDQSVQSPAGIHGVTHYWLCERCSNVFHLAYDERQCVVLKLLCPEFPAGESRKKSTGT
jgi:hypothetical protein